MPPRPASGGPGDQPPPRATRSQRLNDVYGRPIAPTSGGTARQRANLAARQTTTPASIRRRVAASARAFSSLSLRQLEELYEQSKDEEGEEHIYVLEPGVSLSDALQHQQDDTAPDAQSSEVEDNIDVAHPAAASSAPINTQAAPVNTQAAPVNPPQAAPVNTQVGLANPAQAGPAIPPQAVLSNLQTGAVSTLPGLSNTQAGPVNPTQTGPVNPTQAGTTIAQAGPVNPAQAAPASQVSGRRGSHPIVLIDNTPTPGWKPASAFAAASSVSAPSVSGNLASGTSNIPTPSANSAPTPVSGIASSTPSSIAPPTASSVSAPAASSVPAPAASSAPAPSVSGIASSTPSSIAPAAASGVSAPAASSVPAPAANSVSAPPRTSVFNGPAPIRHRPSGSSRPQRNAIRAKYVFVDEDDDENDDDDEDEEPDADYDAYVPPLQLPVDEEDEEEEDDAVEEADEPLSQEEEGGAASLKKPERKIKTRTSGKQTSIAGSAAKLTEMQTQFDKIKGGFDISLNPTLIYADRVRKLLSDAALLRHVAPYKRAEPAQLLTTFLNTPPPRNARVWRHESVAASTQAGATHGHVTRFVSGTTRLVGNLSYAALAKEDPQFDHLTRTICDNVVRLLNRWPLGVPDSNTMGVIMKEVAHTVVSVPKVINLPAVDGGDKRMRVTINYIDSQTNKAVGHNLLLSPGPMALVDINQIPDVNRLCKYITHREPVATKTDKQGNVYTPSVISNALRKKWGSDGDKAEKFLRFAAYRLHGQITTREGIDEMWQDLLSGYGGSVDKPMSSYGGSSLFNATASSQRRDVTYTFGRAVAQDISGISIMQQIAKVRTLDGVLASAPLEVGLRHYLSSGDPRSAALYNAEASDFVNEQIAVQQIGVAGCFCDERMKLEVPHFCQSGLHEVLCANLVEYQGARICKGCKIKREAASQSGGSSGAHVVDAAISFTVRDNHRVECRTLEKDVDSAAEQQRLADMLAKLRANYRPNNGWFDEYTSIERTVQGITNVRPRRDPFVCSGDAVEPYGLSHDGTMRVHTANNMAMTTSGLNYIKQRQLVGFLEELALFRLLRTPRSEDEKDEFLKICDDLYIVATKTPFTKKARLAGRGINDLLADQAEWRCGKPIDESGPWATLLWRWSLDDAAIQVADPWDEETTDGLGGLSDEIQTASGKNFPKAPDNAPWPFPGPMPKKWNWKCWNVATEQRLKRMRLVCNRHGITHDSSQGLFAEIIWQLCNDKGEYQEFLDLPRTIWLRHPLCISIAHKVHGKSMATGWPLEPRHLFERDNKRNNMLVETWTSNTAKMDMLKKDCDDLLEDVEKVKLFHRELYDKTRNPSVPNFPKRNDQIKFGDLTWNDVQNEGLDRTIDVDLPAEGSQQ
ncbi:hypothetical protein KCU65_g7922, partial [Aureobasidium melanogenum]